MTTTMKRDRADRLSPEARKTFYARCAEIERGLTEACTSTHDPCMEGGCSVEDEDETCLQPIERAGTEYDRACDAIFEELYADPRNRALW